MKKFIVSVLTVLTAVCTLFATACFGGGNPNYTLNFMVEGQIYQNGPVTGGQVVVLPSDPFKYEHEFDGWYFDEGVWERPFTENSLVGVQVTENIYVYAKFTYKHECFYEITPNNDGTHTKTCTINSEHVVTENCSGGNATCELQATCSICLAPYGSTIDCDYSNGDRCPMCNKTWYTEDLQYTLINGDTAYEVSIGSHDQVCEIVIPSVYNNLPVTSIAENGFNDQWWMESIVLPDSITNIGKGAFYNTGLIEVDLPDNVTVLPDEVFGYCIKLKSITLPSNLQSIGDKAFLLCETLESVKIPNGVTSIGEYAFCDCSADITWGDNPQITAIGDNAFYGYEGTNLTLPNGVTSIGHSAVFACTNLESINIPNTVTSIGNTAFAECSAEITWGDNPQITTIGYGAFCRYAGTSLTIPNSVTSIGKLAFSESSIQSITLSDKVKSIGDNAFNCCYSLKSITLPNSVESLGTGVFYACSALESVTLSNNLTSLGSSVFDDCSATINWGSNPKISTIAVRAFENYLGTTLTLPNSVLNVSEYAFYKCVSLESVSIPNSVTSLGAGAFSGCVLLKSITLSDNIKTLEDYTFENCTSLESIKIPNKVTKILHYVFNGCVSLASVTFNSVLESIYAETFKGCVKLTEIAIPSTVTYIGSEAFKDCTSLASVTINGGLEQLCEKAFAGCTALTSIKLPSVAFAVYQNVFAGCTALTIYCELTEEDAVSFYDGWNGGCPVVWNCNDNDVATDGFIYTVIDGVRYGIMGETAYVARQSSTIKTAIIKKSITYKGVSYDVEDIRANAFDGCKSLESVVIPTKVLNVRQNAFDNCDSLNAVYYEGQASKWNEISIASPNAKLESVTIYYYVENQSDLPNSGDYWHYDLSGNPVKW